MMTLNDVDEGVAEVRRLVGRGDREAAHSEEDKLHQKVLLTIARERLTETEMRNLADRALTTRDISYERWCA
jgi:hypothetical protein